jgi:alpha-1,6-mannosyltransferase
MVSSERPVGLVIYGDGPLKSWVQWRAARIPGVNLAGFTRDRLELAGVLASADGLLHGSAAETYGLVVAEALCSGLPLVVPDRGGAADLAQPAHAETYPPGDASGCAEAIRRLLSRDAETLRRDCRAAARDRVLSLDEHFERLFAGYAERLSERG